VGTALPILAPVEDLAPLRDLLIVAAAFLIGGIPWGVIIARVVGGPDPRTLGSGRTGGANVLRALGPGAALASGLLDMLKGTVAVLLARWLGAGPWIEVLAATAAIIGHTYSPFLGFKGGRGVATGWGALLVISPLAALSVVPVFIVIVLTTGYSSLGSLIGSAVAGAVLFVQTLATDGSPAYLAYSVIGAGLIWVFHRDNIARLMRGEERKLQWGRRGAQDAGAVPAGAAPAVDGADTATTGAVSEAPDPHRPGEPPTPQQPR
jgi:glycerol-3-phosphate acyltransferase PlsY